MLLTRRPAGISVSGDLMDDHHASSSPAPASSASRPRLGTGAWVSIYVALLVLAVVVGFMVGAARWEAGCPDPDEGPCSGVPEVTGLFWAAGAVVLVLASAVALELVLRRRSGPAYRRA